MILLIPLFEVLMITINLYKWAVIVMVILSWLLAFGVVNQSNAFVNGLNDFLVRITEPLLSKIRNLLPTINNIDLAPIVLILFLYFIERVLSIIFVKYIMTTVGGMIN